MKFQDVNWKWKAGGGSAIGITALFSLLFLLSGMTYTHSGDSDLYYLLDGSITGEAYINVTTTYWRVCFEHSDNPDLLYKKKTLSRTLWANLNYVDDIIQTSPKVSVDWLVPTRGVDNWRYLKDGDCWDRGKINKIKLVAHPERRTDVKWSFMLDEVNIDPVWRAPKLEVELKKECKTKGALGEKYNYSTIEVCEKNITGCYDKVIGWQPAIIIEQYDCIQKLNTSQGIIRLEGGWKCINKTECDNDNYGDGDGKCSAYGGELCYNPSEDKYKSGVKDYSKENRLPEFEKLEVTK